ncbi:ANK_REP_REGION domain-containing protein [Caerostris darwini]|uniref:ANK_REP_REGION domain-containing protein n=1 Tax=Caerostris darwini TaxID=1538125 RepID=A0AAV4U358_9ARAC|nr:ANK_REP_REGION domain-containing protein [Caerostris darwini]
MSCKTGVSTKNKDLEKAIKERKCNEVKLLLANGADINHSVNQNQDTMLHIEKHCGIACDILGYSADVNARNIHQKTPLHTAVIDGKSPEFVKTLLEHAAEVDVKDCDECTPLHYAIKREHQKEEVIGLLIMFGADPGVKDPYSFDANGQYSPLDVAVKNEDEKCIKAILKYMALRRSHENCITGLDLRGYYRSLIYYSMRGYLVDCSAEINRMKKEKLNNMTLFEMVTTKYIPYVSLYTDKESMKSFTQKSIDIIASKRYPIYQCLITEKLKNKLEVKALKMMFNDLQIYFVKSDSVESEKKYLDQVINSTLAKYLFKNELFNFILAFYEPNEHSSLEALSESDLASTRREPNKRLCETSTSSSCSKYMRLL